MKVKEFVIKLIERKVAQRIKDALETGEAYYTKTEGKHIYFYKLKN